MATESGQVALVGISLADAGPVLHLKNHAGVETDLYLDYPVGADDLRAAMEIEDESAVVRSEMCAATLTWMSDHAVPSSDGFEEFFRWAVFGELIFDDDGLALLGSDGVPVSLPAGWVLEPRREARVDAIAVHLERPHVAAVRETTWLTMRADGWSRVRIGPTGPASETVGLPAPPRFVTVRPDADTSRSAAWFRNEEVVGTALISYVADCRRHQAY